MEYNDFNDFELLSYIGEQNEEASEILYQKYQPLITSIAKRVYRQVKNKAGIELSDLIQEGMVGFSNAIKNYDEMNGVMFFTYAKTCIERKVISTVISAGRLKNRILNESISLNAQMDYNEQAVIDPYLSDNRMNPEVLLMSSEEETELQKKIYQLLNDQERQVLELKVSGFSYQEIAKLLDLNKKKIDNTMQKIRYKLKKGE